MTDMVTSDGGAVSATSGPGDGARPDSGGDACALNRTAASAADSEADSRSVVARSDRVPLAAVGPGSDPLTAAEGSEDRSPRQER